MKSNYPVFPKLVLKALTSAGNFKPTGRNKSFINYCVLAALLIMPFITQAQVLYVTPTGAGNHSGSSWGNAATLYEATYNWLACQLAGCTPNPESCGQEIWVAQGVHQAATSGNGLGFYESLYGGFQGNETQRSQRNPALYVTQINATTNGINNLNIIAIVGTCSPPSQITIDGVKFKNAEFTLDNDITFVNCTFDGSTITTGQIGGNLTANNCIFKNNSVTDLVGEHDQTATFTQCTFTSINAGQLAAVNAFTVNCTSCTFDSMLSTGMAAAVECNGGTFQSCTFSNGSGTSSGAVVCQTFNDANFQSCTFTNNRAGNGAGALELAANGTVTNCKFINNQCSNQGGAILHPTGDGYILTVENCLFVNNSAPTAGGAIYDNATGCTFALNTFVNNSAPNGSAIKNDGYTTTIANNIFEGSAANGYPIYKDNMSISDVFGISYYNNISSDGSVGPAEDAALTATYTPSQCSPAINAGNNNYIYGLSTDLAGNTRKYNGTVDIGCYEFQGTKYATPPISFANLPNGTPHDTAMCYGNVILLEYNGVFNASSYTWYDNGILDTTVSSVGLIITPPPGVNQYSLIAHGVCDLRSDSFTITVGPALYTATLATSTPTYPDLQGICPGTPLVVTAHPGSGGASCPATDTYQYSIDNGATYHPYTLGDTINTTGLIGAAYVMTTRTACGCAAQNYIASWGSAAITPAVTIAASAQVILAGHGVAFTATPSNAGSSPNYQWKQNGQNVGTNSNFYFANSVHNGDVFSCVLSHATISTGCLFSTTATSNNITINVISDSASLSATGSCAGSSIVLNSQLNPEMIVWEHNGNPVDTTFSGWNPNAIPVSPLADTAPVAVFVDALGNTYVGYATQVIKFAPGDTVGVVAAGYYQYQIQGLTALYVDGAGNVYVAEAGGVQKWISNTVAGVVAGFFDYSYGIRGLYVDQQGNVYTVDGWTSIVTKWLSLYNPLTIAGLHNGGSNAANDFQNPYGITFDGQGNMYIADYGNNRVQKWGPLADSGITVAGGHGAGNAANQLNGPTSVSVDQFGNLYINDSANFRIQMWKPGATSGITIAGGNGRGNGLNQFSQPRNSNMDIYGNLYVADEGDGVTSHGRILKFNPVINDTLVTQSNGEYDAFVYPFLNGQTNGLTLIPTQPVEITPATSTAQVTITANPGNEVCNGMGLQFTANAINGGSNPTFEWLVNGTPSGINQPFFVYNNAQLGDQIACVMTSNALCTLPLIDTSNVITLQPATTAVSISIQGGTNICPGSPSIFTATPGVTGTNYYYQWIKNGNNAGAQTSNNTYSDATLNPGDIVSCIIYNELPCANPTQAPSNSIQITGLYKASINTANGNCMGSPLLDNVNFTPASMAWEQNGTVVQSAPAQWNPTGITVAGGRTNGNDNEILYSPGGVFVDNSGFIYAANPGFNVVQKWAAVDTGSTIVAGQDGPPGNGPSKLNAPQGVFVDGANNIYVADQNNYRVQKWAPGATQGITVAGGNGAGNGPSQLGFQFGIFVDVAGNVYVADQTNSRIQKWLPGANSGITVAGTTSQFDSNFPDSYLMGPTALYVDANGTMFIADYSRVIVWDKNATSGTTILGSWDNAGSGANQLNGVNGIWLDGLNNIYVCDGQNNRIQVWQPATNQVTTAAGGNGQGNSANQLSSPSGVYVDNNGNIYVSDRSNNRVQEFSPVTQAFVIPAFSADTFTFTATSFSGCTVVSAPVIINPIVTPGITISAQPSGTICANTPVTFTLSDSNAGTTPVYTWYKNGNQVSAGTSYTGIFNNNDKVFCMLQSNAACAQPPVAQSNIIILNVVGNNSTTTLNQSICSGSNYNFNGRILSSQGTYRDTLTAVGGCDSIITLNLTVTPSVTPGVGLATTTGFPICAGSGASFTAQPQNGGTSPVYQWYLNGNPSGTNSPNYSSNTFNNNDKLYCVITSNATCATPLTANSDTATITVTPLLSPSVSLSVSGGRDTTCRGTAVTFTATPTNAGTSLLYVFKVNGATAQTGSSATFTTSTLNNNDSVSCVMTILNNHLCVTTTTATSNIITMTVGVPPVISCPGRDTANTDAGLCSSSAIIGTATATGGCGNVIISHSPVGPYPVGTTTVTWKALDQNGDSSTCTQLVTVIDNELPTITSAGTVNVTTDGGHCYASNVSLGTPQTNDNCGVLSVTNNAPGQYQVGSTTVIWTITDIHNNTNTCNQTVNVTDNELPTITCPATVNVTADAGHCYASGVSLGTPVTNDNCGVLSVTNNAPSQYPVGSTTVIWTITDIHNNTNTCNQTVNVTDNQLPTITSAGTVNVTADAGHCYASGVSLGTPVTNDNCGVLSVTNNAPSQYPVGSTIVIWTITDIHNNTNTCNQIVNVTDIELPTITCSATVNVTADAGHCYASGVSLGTPVTNDNCGVLSVTNNAPTQYPVGSTTVIWTITDIHNNTNTCNQTVNVTDNELPTITCPATVNVTADAGHCYASAVSLGTPVTNDNCGVLSVTNNAPSQYPVGSTTVIWTITDIHSNTNTCNQIVNVTDIELPTITCPATVNVTADAGHCYASGVSLGTPVTNDNCGVLSVTNNAPSQYPVGSTTVIWTITDIHNNTNTCNQTVNVTDNQLPTITSAGTVNVTADAGHCYASGVSLGTPVTNDNCGVLSVTNNAPSQYQVGSTTVIWTITDIHNNTNTCNQTVNVTDNELPTITCPATVNVTADAGHCYASGVSLGTPVTNDNCGVLSVTNNAPSQYQVGSTTVIWTITDIHNNTNTCNQTVNVTDNQVPVITCPASISITANQTVCNKALTIATPGATDNCGIGSVKNSFNGTSNASGTYPVGTTNVVWTATDIHNLTATCTQVVTIYPCINIAATVNNTICVGTSNGSIAISVNGGNGSYTYHWNNGQTTANLSNLAAATYTVTVNDQSQGTATATFTVGTTVPAAKPATPGAISGLTQFCPNTTTTYSISSVPYASSYTWSVPSNATIQSGQGSTQISVKFSSSFSSGTVSVLASNCKGSSNKNNLTVSVYAIPAKPVSITGPATVCSGSTQSYSTLSVSGATSYTWSVPTHCTIISGQNSTSVTVQYQTGFTSGNISVYATNCSGSSAVKSLGVSIEPLPNQPGTISGASSICTGIVYQYLISAVTNANSYTWTVPTGATLLSGQGTTSITLQYSTFTSGNVSVYASNCTGNGSAKSLTISKLTAPAQPSYVTGNTTVCPNETYQYTVSSVTNATAYNWTLPSNATIVSGQGSNTLTVQYGSSFSGGTLSVYASNCAGNSTAKSITITKATRGCGGTRMDEIDSSDNASTAIVEPTDVDFKVILYPNPFASQCRLNITSPSTEPVTLKIYSITGQLIEEKTEQFTGTDIIMGNTLAGGVYLVEVKQQDRTKVLRFIKSE